MSAGGAGRTGVCKISKELALPSTYDGATKSVASVLVIVATDSAFAAAPSCPWNSVPSTLTLPPVALMC